MKDLTYMEAAAAEDLPASLSAQRKARLRALADAQAEERDRWIDRSAYFHGDEARYMRFLVPPGLKVLEIGCGTGRLLAALAMSVMAASPGLAQTAGLGAAGELVDPDVLRVCADPSNMPFTDEGGGGFENALAEFVASQTGRKAVAYTWFPMVMGFVRNTLAARRCDTIMGYPQGDELVQNTNAYYRSSYVLIYRRGGDLDGTETLADPKLAGKRVGVVQGTPPVTGLPGAAPGSGLPVFASTFAAIAVHTGSSSAHASRLPPGIRDGPKRAPSSPPDTPEPTNNKPCSASARSRRMVSVKSALPPSPTSRRMASRIFCEPDSLPIHKR